MPMAIYSTGKFIEQIFGKGACVTQNEHDIGYTLRTVELGNYHLEFKIFQSIETIWNELWSIKNSITLYLYNPVVAA